MKLYSPHLRRDVVTTLWQIVFQTSAILIIMAAFLAMTTNSHAAAPAGTLVGNQGSMEFVDSEGVRRTVSSNLVEIEVLQVYSVVVEGGLEKNVSSGGQVTFPHTLTNTGNGDDDFDLEALNALDDDFDFTDIQIFADDGTGQPTGAAITSTGNLPAGESFQFVIVANVPNGQARGRRGRINVNGRSRGDNNATDSNIDTAVISDTAVLEIRKALSSTSGAPGNDTQHTITLTISNVSGSVSGQADISDVLAEGYSYVAESAVWSESGTALTDDQAGDPAGIDYSYDEATRTVSISLDSVAANDEQTISFGFVVPEGTPAGDLDNTADMSYDDGAGTTETTESNTVSFDVDQVGGSDAGDQSPDGNTLSGTDQDGVANDVIFVPTAPQGTDVPFEVIVTNTGNGDDVFNITLPVDDFPPGTVFTVVKADGSTPLIDTDGDGIPDTGSLAPGESTSVIVIATLPEDVVGDNDGNGFSVTITATSGLDGTVDTATATLGSIGQAAVDLTQDLSVDDGATPQDGAGPGPETDPIRSVSTDPTEPALFNLWVNNRGGSAQNYSLSTPVLPSGWTVLYYFDDGDGVRGAGDTQVTDGKTGVIEGGDERLIFAEVTPPAGSVAGNYDVDFRVVSSTSGASDTIHDEVVVNAVSDIQLTGNNVGTTTPGGQIVYSHQVINNGSVDTEVNLSANNSAPGWTTELFIDTNGNGIIDDQDTLVTGPFTVTAGQTVELLSRVTAPADADNNDSNTTTLSGTFNGEQVDPVTDVTTVSSGEASLVKEQALDSNCDGTPEGTYTQDVVQGNPDECVSYRLTGTNTGSTDLANVRISDFTPEYTTYFDCGGSCAATASGGNVSAPASGSEGAVAATRDSLAPGASETLTFIVRLEP